MDTLLNAVHWINESTAGATEVITGISDTLWAYFLMYALVAVGLGITIATRGVQFRLIGEMFRTLKDPAGTEYNGKKSISAFRAFTVSAASRVGVGNIVGVAMAIILGGPGAVFWMWVIASIGAASAFAESLLGLHRRPCLLHGPWPQCPLAGPHLRGLHRDHLRLRLRSRANQLHRGRSGRLLRH